MADTHPEPQAAETAVWVRVRPSWRYHPTRLVGLTILGIGPRRPRRPPAGGLVLKLTVRASMVPKAEP